MEPEHLDRWGHSAHSKMRRVGYLLGGKDVRTTLAGLTTSTTTPDQPAGIDHPPLALRKLNEMSVMPILRWSVKDI
jgi:hypothetical protein